MQMQYSSDQGLYIQQNSNPNSSRVFGRNGKATFKSYVDIQSNKNAKAFWNKNKVARFILPDLNTYYKAITIKKLVSVKE